ncbi:nephrocystin-4-like isoform X2 [Centruroides vittatus]|uniref:nephrocystin-4-like isoform X2 n=1 Tax=Centruroides vittatus TaxID=120091 RepID=UPI00350F31E2
MESRQLKFKRLIFNEKNKKKIEQSEDVAVAVNLLFIDGLPFQSNQVEFCQVHGTLFDIQENQFIGRTCTIINTSDIKRRKLNIEKNIYFYTSNEEKLILIIEVSVQKKETKYTESIGWGILQPLQFMKKSTDTSLKRLSLLHGSPRVLLVIGNPFELKDGHALPSKLQSTEVVYTVHPHYALLKVNHLFPENTLLCDSDVIPGLISTHDDLQIKDVLKKPKLQKCTTCVLDHIFIKISPSIVDFENELITKVKEDKTSEELSSSTDISVAERRLIVGVHNSWNYIQEKEVHHLVIGSMKHYSNSSLSKISSSKSKKDGDEMILLLRNRVKLNIPEDFNIFLVFFLEYVLSFVTTPKDRKTSTFPVLLNWCKWYPFVEKVSTDISLNLNFGPAENIEEKLLYRTKNIQMSFNCSTLIGKKKGLIPLKNEESNQEKLVSPSKSFNEPEQNQAKFVSRATYSLLQAVGFPPIRDQQGKLPHTVDSLNSTDFEKEIQDPYICNDIILQFLAYSCHLDSKRFFPHVLFFTFQFYRFPPVQTERLLLENQDNINYNKPYILYCFKSGGNKKAPIPGYHVRYHIDPAYLTPGERKEFLNYIYSHWLHIDVWDGNSLLYVGTASLQLRCLCRQGKEAVQSMLELDIWQENYVDECANRVNNEKKLQGNLYLRIANIGSPSSITSLKKIHDLSSTNLPPIVIPQPVNKHEYKACLVTKARPVVELNQEISSFLVSHFDDLYLENVIGLSEEKRRKLARMEAVRKAIEENGNVCKMNKQKIFTDRVKDFHTIDAYRENQKHENILSILQKSITVETTIHPMLGSTYFFEFELTNPYPREHRIFIECQHPSLNVVFCTDEWKHFRQLWKIEEFVEEHFFSQSNFQKGTMPQLFVRPYEKVRIPFKYLSLNNIAKCESWKATSGHIFTAEMLTKYPLSDYFKPFTIKVNFKTEDAKLIYILNINIQPVPPNIQQSFYFLVSENAFLNRRIRISKRVITLINRKHFSQINILCSDNNVICGIQRSENIKDQIDIYFKAACGEAGIERRFYLFLYDSPFMSKPIHTWLIETLTVQRIDISCHMGQCVQSSVVLKGADETHLVQCFTSHPTELQLFPNGYFTLSANTFQELQLIAKSDLPGTKKIYVNLVNMEFYSLMKTWLIVLMCQRPTITKSYQVQLSITSQDIAIKRITYSNQYNYPKTYLVSSSHPQLLQLAEQKFSIKPRKNYSLGLLFFPQHKPMSEEIFIFVNNLEGKNEETFSIRMVVS